MRFEETYAHFFWPILKNVGSRTLAQSLHPSSAVLDQLAWRNVAGLRLRQQISHWKKTHLPGELPPQPKWLEVHVGKCSFVSDSFHIQTNMYSRDIYMGVTTHLLMNDMLHQLIQIIFHIHTVEVSEMLHLEFDSDSLDFLHQQWGTPCAVSNAGSDRNQKSGQKMSKNQQTTQKSLFIFTVCFKQGIPIADVYTVPKTKHGVEFHYL